MGYTVHRVTKSWTWLKSLSTHANMPVTALFLGLEIQFSDSLKSAGHPV